MKLNLLKMEYTERENKLVEMIKEIIKKEVPDSTEEPSSFSFENYKASFSGDEIVEVCFSFDGKIHCATFDKDDNLDSTIVVEDSEGESETMQDEGSDTESSVEEKQMPTEESIMNVDEKLKAMEEMLKVCMQKQEELFAKMESFEKPAEKSQEKEIIADKVVEKSMKEEKSDPKNFVGSYVISN